MVMREEEPPRTGLRGWLSNPEVQGWFLQRFKHLLKATAEALQEAGILILVFGLLDFYIKTDPGADALWPQKVAKVGVPILVGGILMKVLLVGDREPCPTCLFESSLGPSAPSARSAFLPLSQPPCSNAT